MLCAACMERVVYARGRCRRCYDYLRRRGFDRDPEREGRPDHPDDDPTAVAITREEYDAITDEDHRRRLHEEFG